MPRERPQPEPFEPSWLDRSLNRYLLAGIVFMAVLVAGFIGYRVREPSLRSDAARAQTADYTNIGQQVFLANCSQCHGDHGSGGAGAPTLDSKQFLGSTSDAQIHALVAGGISGTEMPAWSLDFGGTFTDEQVTQIVTYVRSLDRHAPSVPNWRQGGTATPSTTPTSTPSTRTPSGPTITLSEMRVVVSSPTFTPGSYTFTITNTGKIVHELLVFKSDLAPAAYPRQSNGAIAEEGPGITKISDGDNINPGRSQTRKIDLTQPGKYLFVCNLPGHFAKGMYEEILVP